MSWYTSMKATNQLIQYFLLFAHWFKIARKTILIIDHSPNSTSIILCKCFFIKIYIKVLSFIILQILYVPHSKRINIFSLVRSLICPKITIHSCLNSLISFWPFCWYIFFITSAHVATSTIAHLDLCPERAIIF